MAKIWAVATFHLQKNIYKKSFFFVLLSIPFLIALMVGVIALSVSSRENNAPVGYVDDIGLIQTDSQFTSREDDAPVMMIPYQDEQEAKQALENGAIQSYFVIPEDYFQNRSIELVYLEKPGENTYSDFRDLLQFNLAADLHLEVRQRITAGTNLIIRSPDGKREYPKDAPTMGMIMPIIISLAFIGLILFSSGYMLEGVSEEKINRTIEVVITSLSPTQLIIGKVLGIVFISLLQLITWVLFGILAVYFAAHVLNIAWFQNPDLNWSSILVLTTMGALTYIITTALMLALGSTVVQAQEGQGVGGIFYMLMFAPLIAIAVIGENPNGPVAIAMSLLPFTSLLTISIRNMFITIPTWQVVVSILVQITIAAGMLWLAIRTFRLGMLRYGKRLRLREIIGRKSASGAQGGFS
jgi:ABC-2 type transport system permease protein